MMPRSAEAPFDSVDHVSSRAGAAGARWPHRAGAPGQADPSAARRHRTRPGAAFAELAYIADLVGEPPAILDGELVVPDRSGRMDHEALAGRLADGQTTGLSPVYLVFDLLWPAGGRWSPSLWSSAANAWRRS